VWASNGIAQCVPFQFQDVPTHLWRTCMCVWREIVTEHPLSEADFALAGEVTCHRCLHFAQGAVSTKSTAEQAGPKHQHRLCNGTPACPLRLVKFLIVKCQGQCFDPKTFKTRMRPWYHSQRTSCQKRQYSYRHYHTTNQDKQKVA
jgi:hypothetical protein